MGGKPSKKAAEEPAPAASAEAEAPAGDAAPQGEPPAAPQGDDTTGSGEGDGGEALAGSESPGPTAAAAAADEPDTSKLLSRRATTKNNPWKTIKKRPARTKRHSIAPPNLVDPDCLSRRWFAMNVDREAAVARLENVLSVVPDGTFVIYSSNQDFGVICLKHDGNLFHAHIVDTADGRLRLKRTKETIDFGCLSALVDHYASPEQTALPVRLDSDALDDVRRDNTALVNGLYDSSPFAPGTENYLAVEGQEPDAVVVEDDSSGFISISHEAFDKGTPARGVSFKACQTSQWFYIGLSDVSNNYHGLRDAHFDDIDFSVFCMGMGKATPKEGEDEVGPYIDYKEGDRFEVRIAEDNSSVEFVHNEKVFWHSGAAPSFPLYVVQAFHPVNGGQTLISEVRWVSFGSTDTKAARKANKKKAKAASR